MKILLTTLNSKYIHTNLAIRYLKEYSSDLPIEIKEFTINQSIDYIVGEIYKTGANIIAFSTYIWNIRETLEISEILKIINPDIKILLGGPEVSYDGLDLLNKYDFIDYIMYGEGEETFRELVISLMEKSDVSKVKGIYYREDGIAKYTEGRPMICDLDSIPSPYKSIGDEYKNKIVYFESSRGCPFNCKFCLSSTIKGLRFFSLERVLEDLDRLIKADVKQVKFVDRTFNAKKDYAMAIMNFIMEKDPKNMNFHFEVTAHLLDEEMLEFLKKPKKGLFQFEIGVQSTNPKTLEAVGRNMDFEKLVQVVKRIKSYGNIHQHLDLIAGLPYEDYESFKKSFNDVYSIGAEKIQLGFLKLLKGSALREEKDKYGFKFLNKPPYEVLATNWISYGEMLRLKGIEDLVEKYHNEHYFVHSLNFIIKNYFPSPFDFFEDLLDFWESKNYHKRSHSRNNLYKILAEYYIERDFNRRYLDELLKYDYFLNNLNNNPPKFIKRKDIIKQEDKHEILKDEELLDSFLKHYKDLPTKKFINNVIVEKFSIDIEALINNNYKEDSKLERVSVFIFDLDRENNEISSYNISDIKF